ncbi:MAG: L2 protein [Fish-associated papillomavirus 1]|nr:MAG: L2 protein [Fish-associated papillomavirus 1]
MVLDDGHADWEWDPDTGQYISKKKENWYQTLSKWFAGTLFTGGLEYTAEEAGAAVSRALQEAQSVTASIIGELPGTETIELQQISHQTDHISVPDLTQVSAPSEIAIRPPVSLAPKAPVNIAVKPSTSTYFNHAFEHEPDLFDTEFSRFHDEEYIVNTFDSELQVSKGMTTSTPVGKPKGINVNYRLPYTHGDVPFGEEEVVLKGRGFLNKVRTKFDSWGNTRSGGYQRLGQEIEPISEIEMEEIVFTPHQEMMDPEILNGEEQVLYRRPVPRNPMFDRIDKAIRGQPVRAHRLGFSVQEEGGWKNVGHSYGLGNYVEPHVGRNRRTPSSKPTPKPRPRPRPGPSPSPQPRPIPPAPKPKRGSFQDIEFTVRGHLKKKKKCKKVCIKKVKGKCVKRKLRCTL